MAVEVPHFDLPFRRDALTGHAAVNEQDTPDDLAACVEAVCRTIVGEREDRPEFGVPELALTRRPLDVEALTRQIEQWEPRVRVLIEEEPEAFQQVLARLGIAMGPA